MDSGQELSPHYQNRPTETAAGGTARRRLPIERAWRHFTGLLDYVLPAETHLKLLWFLILGSFFLRMVWLSQPQGLLIFDEQYYVNAARVIVGITPTHERYTDKPFGLDPNTEHPPLAKLLVAGSILVWGDNAVGWRLPSVIFGTAGILLMYGIARRVGASGYMALVVAGLLAFDNLVFVHSRIFTLDIFQMVFMLLGLYWYLGNRSALAGAGFALAALTKIGGGLGLLAVALYEALRLLHGDSSWRASWRPAARRLMLTGLAFGAVFLLLLGLMDRIWVGYSQPFEHLNRIFSYGMARRREIPAGIESYPWEWLWNDREIPYLSVQQQVRAEDQGRESRPPVQFLGAMNPYVLQLLPLGLLCAGYAWWRRRPGAGLGALALAWFAATYLPLVAASVFGHRISYLFYFLPSLPAVALAGGYFLLEMGLPRPVAWGYLVAVLLGFYGYFPFKSFPS